MAKEKTEREKLIEKVREMAATHIVEVEVDTQANGTKTFTGSFEHARLIQITALGEMEKRYHDMFRTKKYRKLLEQYGNVLECIQKADNDKELKSFEKQKRMLQKELDAMQKTYGVTKSEAEQLTKLLQKRFCKAQAVIAQTIANRVWQAIEALLFDEGEHVHYKTKDAFQSIEGKQNERCIMLKRKKDGQFYLSYLGQSFPLIFKKNDLFIEETFANIGYFLDNADVFEEENIQRYLDKEPLLSTYRVKYNRIVRKEIRGKNRYFLQVVLEGSPVPKRKKDGSFRHTLGTGVIGNDIGTRSMAITSESLVEIKNLAERTSKNRQRQMHLIQNKLNRSQKATNPTYYDEKGRIKKGKKTWKKSKRYQKNQRKVRNLHRILAENRKYAHNEDVNWLRSLGDTMNVETMQWKALQKKAKVVSKNEKTGKFNKRKRFGKSILECSPGYLIEKAKKRFEETGGKVNEVNTWTFKASQYDHKLGDTNKKQLSQRWHIFQDGEKVQRDSYSSFLLACADEEFAKPNQDVCNKRYEQYKKLHDDCIKRIIAERRLVSNSGIKVVMPVMKEKKTFKEKKKDRWFAHLNKVEKREKKKVLLAV